MTSREKVQNALAHRSGPVPLDLGGTSVTGIHVNTVHNIQGNVPTENIVAMIEALRG